MNDKKKARERPNMYSIGIILACVLNEGSQNALIVINLGHTQR
jgi:hypothetical protein